MSLSVLHNKMKQYFVICISFLCSFCVLIAYTYTSDLVYIQLYYHLMYLIYHVRCGWENKWTLNFEQSWTPFTLRGLFMARFGSSRHTVECSCLERLQWHLLSSWFPYILLFISLMYFYFFLLKIGMVHHVVILNFEFTG